MRTVRILLLTCLMLSILVPPVYGSDTARVLLKGQLVALDEDQRPIIKGGNALIPMRAIFEALGADISWDARTKTVTGRRLGREVQVQIGSSVGVVNGLTVQLSHPTELHKGRTYVPLRFVAEALGASVKWDGTTSTISITLPMVAERGSSNPVLDPQPIAGPTELPSAENDRSDRLAPANHKASKATRKVLDYLEELPQQLANRVLSGQHTGSTTRDVTRWASAQSGYTNLVEGLALLTGQYPALVGADYGSSDQYFRPPGDLAAVNKPLLSHWQRGGIVTLMFSARNPWTGNNQNDRTVGGAGLADLLKPGTAANAAWMAQLDGVAAGLAELRDAGVVVLWRPFHEANAPWFWWGIDPKQIDNLDMVLLWRHMFEYFSNEKGLDNLLWVYSMSAQLSAAVAHETALYPGDDYVDIVGLDDYSDSLTGTAITAYERLLGLGKPFALTEYGPSRASRDGSFDYAPLIDQIRLTIPQTRYFMIWSDFTNALGDSHLALVSNLNADLLLADPWVVTADEVPTDWQTSK